ncbi:hypothetical protein [Streptomyces sp. NBC_01443]|uniref:hypothetical protein n=1 Tax=Streptomyces sp. NBC_01443 TaxID=2903868 RepID=UPI00224F1FE1|nr:hypothetical protein [Streptomyces sp. NBC_01443]MCX4633460.1 hypothetical protein [Streptomyces sp. NBC_01443]
MKRIAVLVPALALVFVSGCTDGTDADGKSTRGTNGSTRSAAPSPASFPSVPPEAAHCPGTVLDHRDISHPDLGAVRVFLIRRTTGSGAPTGCVASVTGSGNALASIDVDIYENDLHFASPESDATKNTFVIYNPGRYDGVLVLVPAKDGYEDVRWTDPDIHYRGGRYAFYHARLVGPGADGRYTIIQSQNSCNPSCADGATSNVTLHWNGHEYLPTG